MFIIRIKNLIKYLLKFCCLKSNNNHSSSIDLEQIELDCLKKELPSLTKSSREYNLVAQDTRLQKITVTERVKSFKESAHIYPISKEEHIFSISLGVQETNLDKEFCVFKNALNESKLNFMEKAKHAILKPIPLTPKSPLSIILNSPGARNSAGWVEEVLEFFV